MNRSFFLTLSVAINLLVIACILLLGRDHLVLTSVSSLAIALHVYLRIRQLSKRFTFQQVSRTKAFSYAIAAGIASASPIIPFLLLTLQRGNFLNTYAMFIAFGTIECLLAFHLIEGARRTLV